MSTSFASPGMDQIDQSFSKVYGMMGPTTGSGGGSGPYGVSPQPMSGDSLTQFFRGLSNLLGTQAPSLVSTGQGLLGTGTGVAQGGTDISGQGLQTTQTGLNTMQPSIDFYSKILSGDPAATAAALAPTAANISQITTGATNQATQGMPAGGYRAATLAGLPFAEAQQVGNAALGLQPAAAQALGQLGTQQATIGGEQAQIGQGIAQTGLGLGQLGAGLTSTGMSSEDAVIRDMLAKMGVNIQGGTANLFSTVVGSL